MDSNSNKEYGLSLAARIKHIMALADLTVKGFSAFTGLSESHLYAVVAGKKEVTTQTAEIIAKSVKMTAAELLKLDRSLPAHFDNVVALNNFKANNEANTEYYLSTEVDRKLTSYIDRMIQNDMLFTDGATVAQIRDACNTDGRNYSSKEISQSVNYLTITRKLEKEMKPIKKKNGEEGSRQIGIFTAIKPEDPHS